MLQQRVKWTKGWLNTFTQENVSTQHQDLCKDYELLHLDDATASDLGVESLSERTLSSEPSPSSENFSHLDLSTQLFDSTPSWPSSAFWERPWICETSGEGYLTHTGHEIELMNANDGDILNRRQAIDYEIGGRTHDNTFSDLRSGSKARKRWQRQKDKYWNWRVIKPGYVGTLVYDTCNRCQNECVCRWGPFWCDPLLGYKISTVTPKMAFKQAQEWPRPHVWTRKPKDRQMFWPKRLHQEKAERKHKRQYICGDIQDEKPEDYDSDERHPGDNMTAFDNDYWDWMNHADWCYICDTPWGYCAGYLPHFEVDQIYSLCFETSADGKSWKLSWNTDTQGPRGSRARDVLPYDQWDWIPHDNYGCYAHDDVRI